jgi:hypothetical protein
MMPTPVIDSRTAPAIEQQLLALLQTHVPELDLFDSAAGKPKGLGGALVAIAARYAEVIIQRLNRLPEKHHLAFLDLLGATQLPPQPARVPISFFLAEGTKTAAFVPRGTQVGSAPSEKQKEPIIFEVEQNIFVSPAKLNWVMVRNPEKDQYADYSSLSQMSVSSCVATFEGNTPIEHLLYLGHPLMKHPNLKELQAKFDVEERLERTEPRTIQWEIWEGSRAVGFDPISDETDHLTKSGHVRWNGLAHLSALEAATSQGSEQACLLGDAELLQALSSSACWLRVCLRTPISTSAQRRDGTVRASQLPRIKKITFQFTLERTGLRLALAFSNMLPLDLTKEFYPFGERPKYGDVLYLGQPGLTSTEGTLVSLHIELVNPSSAVTDPPLPRIRASANLLLIWEYWNGSSWANLGASSPVSESTAESGSGLRDRTKALTESGVLSFTVPNNAKPTRINAVDQDWIRVRIASGDYGKDASYEPKDSQNPEKGYVLKPSTLAPPVIRSITIDLSLTKTEEPPRDVIAYNDFLTQNLTSRILGNSEAVSPFSASQDARPSLFLGFTAPAEFPSDSRLWNLPISLYVQMEEARSEHFTQSRSSVTSQLVGEYWNGQRWAPLSISDDTRGLMRSGLLQFFAPEAFALKTEFGRCAYWCRFWKDRGGYTGDLCGIFLNTTIAQQAVTIEGEMLGSSQGTGQARFRTLRKPVLDAPVLDVREPIGPANDLMQGGWVRWHEVTDFYGSGPADRHYVIDHISGEVRFGDGINGRIPPAGIGNIKMTKYQAGGGLSGNVVRNSIAQIKTTIPYVEKVINPIASSGGADVEPTELMLKRAGHALRHGDRAVTKEDYEDLALLASPEIARSQCVPLLDLSAGRQVSVPKAGTVTVIVVPHSSDRKPLPSLELKERVKKFLDERRDPGVQLIIVEPEYIRVDVDVEVTLSDWHEASQIREAVARALETYLHPLSGSTSGLGWEFAREPHESQLYALIESVPGVDHVERLEIRHTEESAGAKRSGRFLIYSGSHSVRLNFAGQ